jgi:hypothetical protein
MAANHLTDFITAAFAIARIAFTTK